MLKDQMRIISKHYEYLEHQKKELYRALQIVEDLWEAIPMEEKEDYEKGSRADKIADLMDILHNI